jgi:hypothetical protein
MRGASPRIAGACVAADAGAISTGEGSAAASFDFVLFVTKIF